MTIDQIYQLVIKLGIESDLRGVNQVKKLLKKTKEKYEKLSSERKKEFDQEKLNNPYSDTRVFVDHGRPIKKIMAGIDIQPAEILMAKELGVDLVIAHHPVGSALADLADVMHLQADVLAMYGVPINIAESVMHVRISEVARGVHAANHYREIDAARLLGLNLMNIHTLTDNLVQEFLTDFFKKKKLETVGDVMDALSELPEYQEAKRRASGPQITSGRAGNRAGKVYVDMTGGTNPSDKIFQELSKAGVSTIVGMHLNEKSFAEAKGAFLNIIIAGHMASDSLGVNLFLDELEKKGMEIITLSGLIRVKRGK